MDGKVERKEIVIEQQNQTFSFTSNEAPQLVNVDAEKTLVGEKIENKTLEQYIFQYNQASLFMDRYEALNFIKMHKENSDARSVIIKALNDKNDFLRKFALNSVSDLTDEERKNNYATVSDLALNDEKALVRAAALKVLTTNYSDYNNDAVFEKAKKDKSPSVLKALKN